MKGDPRRSRTAVKFRETIATGPAKRRQSSAQPYQLRLPTSTSYINYRESASKGPRFQRNLWARDRLTLIPFSRLQFAVHVNFRPVYRSNDFGKVQVYDRTANSMEMQWVWKIFVRSLGRNKFSFLIRPKDTNDFEKLGRLVYYVMWVKRILGKLRVIEIAKKKAIKSSS